MDRAMPQPIGARRFLLALAALSALTAAALLTPARAQDDAYQPNDAYSAPGDDDDAARPPYRPSGVYREDDSYRRYDDGGRTAAPAPRGPDDAAGYGEPYHAPGEYDDRPPYDGPPDNGYSQNEILEAGRSFFGSVTKGLASVVEYSFRKSGRPNGYILGEDAGGAFIAGLRYGEGTLYTKDAGVHKVYWQGPSIGYDFGGEGSKTMVLVYNLRDPWQIYHRYAGVQGSAYFVGGVGIQYQTYGNVTLAPIRAGVGLRLGANVGYLKYTRSPTWNPF
jgi:hypothetical protein